MYYGLCFFNHGLRLVTQATWSHQLSHVEPPRRCPVVSLWSRLLTHTPPPAYFTITRTSRRARAVCVAAMSPQLS